MGARLREVRLYINQSCIDQWNQEKTRTAASKPPQNMKTFAPGLPIGPLRYWKWRTSIYLANGALWGALSVAWQATQGLSCYCVTEKGKGYENGWEQMVFRCLKRTPKMFHWLISGAQNESTKWISLRGRPMWLFPYSSLSLKKWSHGPYSACSWSECSLRRSFVSQYNILGRNKDARREGSLCFVAQR